MSAFAWGTFLEGAGILAALLVLRWCWRREQRERAYHRRYMARLERRSEDRWWQLWLAGVR